MLDDFFFVLKPSYFSEDNGEMVATIELFGLDGGTNRNNVQMKASGSARRV